MSRQDKIDKIYEVVARKDLSFGCKIQTKNYCKYDGNVKLYIGPYTILNNKYNNLVLMNELEDIYEYIGDDYITNGQEKLEYKIIGHPVMIGDVLDTLRFNFATLQEKVESILYHWEEKREPIENQSDECIEYIYNLILDKCQ